MQEQEQYELLLTNSLYLATNNTTALTINTNQDATFAEDLTVDGEFTFNGGNVQGNVAYTVDMGDTSTYAENTFYPVTIPLPVGRETELRIEVPLNSGDSPSYATHSSGVALYIKWSTIGNGWGTIYPHRTIYEWRERYSSATLVGGITQLTNGSVEVIYLRGGTKYYVYSNRAGLTVTPRSSTYTNNSQTATPSTSIINDVYSSADGNMGLSGVRIKNGAIVSSGNLGIGTSTTSDLLHIKSAAGWGARIAYTDGTYLRLSSNQIAAFTAADAAASLYLNNSHAGNVLANGGGRLGVGTTSPGAKMQVVSTTADWTGGFKNYETDGYGLRVDMSGGSGENAAIQAYTATGTGLIFKNNGLMGIGHFVPSTKVHIQNPNKIDDAYGLLLVENTNTTATSALTNTGINVKNREGTSQFMQWEEHGLRIGSRIITNDGVGDVIFTAGADSEKMRIKAGGNVLIPTAVGIATTSPQALLDVQPTASNRKVTRIANDVTSTYFYNTQADAILAWTCGSYHQAEVVITANQTNGGTTANLYIRGIWSNNHTSHHWDELEHIGSLPGSTVTMSVGQNGSTTASGRLELDFDYINGSFSQLNVRVTDFFGTHSYTIT